MAVRLAFGSSAAATVAAAAALPVDVALIVVEGVGGDSVFSLFGLLLLLLVVETFGEISWRPPPPLAFLFLLETEVGDTGALVQLRDLIPPLAPAGDTLFELLLLFVGEEVCAVVDLGFFISVSKFSLAEDKTCRRSRLSLVLRLLLVLLREED